MSVIEITTDNFEQEVLKSDKVVLVDFWAAWCGPCKALSPIVHEIAEEVPDKKICTVNVDEQRELAFKFNVMSIPTLIVFKDGKAVQTSVGGKPKSAILQMLDI